MTVSGYLKAVMFIMRSDTIYVDVRVSEDSVINGLWTLNPRSFNGFLSLTNYDPLVPLLFRYYYYCRHYYFVWLFIYWLFYGHQLSWLRTVWVAYKLTKPWIFGVYWNIHTCVGDNIKRHISICIYLLVLSAQFISTRFNKWQRSVFRMPSISTVDCRGCDHAGIWTHRMRLLLYLLYSDYGLLSGRLQKSSASSAVEQNVLHLSFVPASDSADLHRSKRFKQKKSTKRM